MKEKYTNPCIVIDKFNTADILTVSGNPADDNDTEWGS